MRGPRCSASYSLTLLPIRSRGAHVFRQRTELRYRTLILTLRGARGGGLRVAGCGYGLLPID